jgi:hypothetical protein
MKNRFLILSAIASLLVFGCKNADEQQEASPKAAVAEMPAKLAALPPTTCRTTETVDFVFESYTEIGFCVDQTAGTITLLHSGNCKQTLQAGDTRRWAVVTISGEKHFKDMASTTTFGSGYPTVISPFDGAGCDLSFISSNTPTCPIILIGRDDIRNDSRNDCLDTHYKIYNSGSTATEYVDIKVESFQEGGVTKYKALMKQGRYTSSSTPPTCSSSDACSTSLCLKAAGGSSTPCP